MIKIKRLATGVVEMVVLALICYNVPTVFKYVVGDSRDYLLGRLALVLATYTLIAFVFSLIVEQRA